jgi:hypothetical protein
MWVLTHRIHYIARFSKKKLRTLHRPFFKEKIAYITSPVFQRKN